MPGSKKALTARTPVTVSIDSPWEEAVTKALAKKRPAEGWPERPKRADGKKKAATKKFAKKKR